MNPLNVPRSLLVIPWLVLLVLPHAAAAAPAAAPPAPVALRAPDALADAEALLTLDANPLADACNTYPADAFETWAAWGREGEWERVRHNGEPASPEMLERAVLEAEGQGWSDAFVVAKRCDKEGGFCACASISLWTGTSVWCLACCPAGTAPFCFCDSLYVYASCACGSSEAASVEGRA